MPYYGHFFQSLSLRCLLCFGLGIISRSLETLVRGLTNDLWTLTSWLVSRSE